MRILITGANGLVGSALCRESARKGHDVFALVREGAETHLVPHNVTIVRGDFSNLQDGAAAVKTSHAEVVMHAAAVVSTGRPNLNESLRINVDGTRTLADAAHTAGVSHWLQVSSMSTRPDNRSVYGGTKFLSEQVVRESGIPHIIFRPSLVYGPQKRGLFYKLVKICSRAPLIPIVGDGNEPLRPIHVDDLAVAMVHALDVEPAVTETYTLGGADAMTLREMIELICRELHRAPFILPLPLPLSRLAALAGELILPNPPLTTDNIEGLRGARPVDNSLAIYDLGFHPRGFRAGLHECIPQLIKMD